jgi:hypothetical protein
MAREWQLKDKRNVQILHESDVCVQLRQQENLYRISTKNSLPSSFYI